MIKFKYDSQALALVLVLLLVGSVIGFALYARSAREAERLVSERASAEANELVETIIGIVGMSDYTNIKSEAVLDFMGCEESDLDTIEGCRKKDIRLIPDMQNLLDDMVETNVNFEHFDRVDDFCRTEIMIRHGLQDDEVVIEKDDMYGIFFDGITNWSPPNGCEIDFRMEPVQHPDGFIMSTFYRNSDGAYKEYKHDDIKGFRYGAGSGNWVSYLERSDISFPSVYPGMVGEYSLYEVRFTAVGGSSALSWEMHNCDMEAYFVMEVGATCHGRYVGKRFNVPSEPFAPPIFDYVLFNGEGELKPERIGN